MNPAILNTPFVQVALPIMVTFIAAAWLNGKRFDDFKGDTNRRFDDLTRDMNQRFSDFSREMDQRFDEIIRRLDRIGTLLADHDQRITWLQERTSPVARR